MKNSSIWSFIGLYETANSWLLILLSMIFLLVVPGMAKAVTCHCFKERTFSPSQPAAADLYILATTRNSLLAASAGIEKEAVVRMRMKGVGETDLWLSHYLSIHVDRSASQLLDARDKVSSWPAALDSIGLDTARLGSAFNDARKGADADRMARALADAVLSKTFGTGESTLLLLRSKKANIAESAIILFLAERLRQTPESILSEVRKGEQTWGALFNSLGIKIDSIGDLIAETVRKTMNGEK